MTGLFNAFGGGLGYPFSIVKTHFILFNEEVSFVNSLAVSKGPG